MHGLKKNLYIFSLMICSVVHNSFASPHIELSDIMHSGHIGNHHTTVRHSENTNRYGALYHSMSQFRVYDEGEEKCCTPRCAGVSVGVAIVLGIIVVASLVGSGDMRYQNYKIDNQVGKPINLHFRGNSFYCYKTVRKTDKDGDTTTSKVQVDCTKMLYPGDRTTLRNYGDLTKLGAYLYDPAWGAEYGWYGKPTQNGLDDHLNWHVTKDGNGVAFNRHFEPVINETSHELNDFRSYHNDSLLDEHTFESAPHYYNLRGSVDLEQK